MTIMSRIPACTRDIALVQGEEIRMPGNSHCSRSSVLIHQMLINVLLGLVLRFQGHSLRPPLPSASLILLSFSGSGFFLSGSRVPP